MAKGAGDDYWASPNLPSKIKHCMMQKYVPIFLGRTSAVSGKVLVLDGYAGRGTYEDGSPGSAGMLLQWALERKEYGRRPVDYILRFYEKDPKNFSYLGPLVDQYKSQGVDVVAERADVVRHVPNVVDEANGIPLFLFVDPTGVGLPFDDLVAALNRPRNARGWPPTEALINLSYDAIRRIGGHVTSVSPNENTMVTLDEAMGGDWWREHFVDGVTHEAVEDVVAEFISRLGHFVGPGAFIASIPVRRDTHHKPLYSLVFVTRHHRAQWHIGDIAAKCLDEGRIAADEAAGRLALSPRRTDLENAAIGDIEANLLALSEQFGVEYPVGDYSEQIFGDHWGEVGEVIVRRAIKSLHAKGLTPSTGVGGKVEDLRFAPKLAN
jgi:three-Cys-motif partner protein